jgi:hypothetical protein
MKMGQDPQELNQGRLHSHSFLSRGISVSWGDPYASAPSNGNQFPRIYIENILLALSSKPSSILLL